MCRPGLIRIVYLNTISLECMGAVGCVNSESVSAWGVKRWYLDCTGCYGGGQLRVMDVKSSVSLRHLLLPVLCDKGADHSFHPQPLHMK